MFSFRRNAKKRSPWFLTRKAILAHVDALHVEVMRLRARIRDLETRVAEREPNPFAERKPQLQTSFGHQDVDEPAEG